MLIPSLVKKLIKCRYYVCFFDRSIDPEREKEGERLLAFLVIPEKKTHGKFLSDAILSYINNRKNYDKMQF